MKQQPLLIVTVGYPGSGKSYFAAQIAADLRAAHLRSDDLRDWLFNDPSYEPHETKHLFSVMNQLADKLLSTGVSVVYDANFSYRKHRDEAREKAARYDARFSLLYVDTPFEVAVERAASRPTHQIGREVVEQMRDEIEDFSDEDPIRIDGTRDYDQQRVEVLSKLAS